MQFRCVLVGLDWDEPMMFLLCISHVYAFFSHRYHFFLILNVSPLHLRTLFVLGYLLLLPLLILLHHMFGSVMIKPVRTFRRTLHDAAFIRNAKLFYQNFLILTFPPLSTVGVGSHCVASQSLVVS